MAIAPEQVTLGILAGGRATRLGGADKAWLRYRGDPLVLRLAAAFRQQVAGILVSANRNLERYAAHGLTAVADRRPGALGPLAGIDALLAACPTPWLLSLPVDLAAWRPDLLSHLVAAAGAGHGAAAADAEGPQPPIALWKVASTRAAVAAALDGGDYAVHAVQARLGFGWAAFPALRFGNLNTPQDFSDDADPR